MESTAFGKRGGKGLSALDTAAGRSPENRWEGVGGLLESAAAIRLWEKLNREGPPTVRALYVRSRHMLKTGKEGVCAKTLLT